MAKRGVIFKKTSSVRYGPVVNVNLELTVARRSTRANIKYVLTSKSRKKEQSVMIDQRSEQ